MAQQQQDAVVLNMADLTVNPPETTSPTSQTKKKQDTLFGPNIGIVARGPDWTETREKAIDELTPDIVRGWIAKSKEANQSTTTLQALVNLKRPSLRLTPLEVSPSDDPDHIDSQHHHGLEFEYDCDAPKCGITVHVVLSSSHRLADTKGSSGQSKVLVFETVTEGGFGRTLKLEEGATLELGRYEHVPRSSPTPSLSEAKGETSSAVNGSPSLDTDTPVSGDEASDVGRKSKLFTSFHLRKRTTQERSVAGPALAVLDAETKEEKHEDKEDEDNIGVKAMIRLSALDSNGKPLVCVNAQTTYLHIVRFGTPPPEEEQDNRPWVVKVVKREATIGAHTFHLHEIYGLSNSTSNAAAAQQQQQAATLPTTYPPTSTPSAPAYDDEPSSECLLCLSAPREVVLLPCRHLVACRECAINMIEFGAGGQIVQASETAPAPTATEAPEENAGNAPAAAGTEAEAGAETEAREEAAEGGEAPAPAAALVTTGPAAPPVTPIPTVIPTTTTRRKRKAKGWFCPVCRQPYTSCLRITTTPPSKDMIEDDHIEAVRVPEHPLAPAPAAPAPAAAPVVSRGGLASLVRPGFLRSFTSRQPQPDLERGPAVVAA